jgi:ABC-type nitrate/sulfonate/bicarbonate transport system substrate-binding protein
MVASSRSSIRFVHSTALVAAVLISLVGLAACSSGSGGTGTSQGAQAPGSSNPAPAPATVTLAMDWTPNTNHSGIYVAQQLGYYRQAGINLRIIPNNGGFQAETLISSHRADFGISYSEGVTLAQAAGGDIVSVFAILQKTDAVIGVRADRSDITSPKNLDGKIYAGFGAPYEVPLLKEVIRNAGGKGNVREVNLTTSAYQAVYAGRADYAMPEPTWEVIEAQLLGKPFKTFDLTQYGAAPTYGALIASSHQFLAAHPDVARRFLAATQKGYAYAAAHPDQAAQILIQANPGAFNNTKLVYLSAKLEADQYYRDVSGRIGYQTLARWTADAAFLYRVGALTDSSGHALTKAPNYAGLFTNAYLPAP